MIGWRVAACIVGSALVVFGGCDDPRAAVPAARVTTAHVTTAMTSSIAPDASTATPTTHTIVAPTETRQVFLLPRPRSTPSTQPTPPPRPTSPTTTPTTTEPAPGRDVTHRQYRMYERNDDVAALQVALSVAVDGTYGPVTRIAHMDYLGGPSAAVYIFFPEFGRTPTPCHDECLPGDGHYELPTLGELVDRYFQPGDRGWALRVAFCESSADPSDIGSVEVSSALAVGWFQHLARYWIDRSTAAGWTDYDIFNAEANVAVAAWLLYEGGGARHWNPSRPCWETE